MKNKLFHLTNEILSEQWQHDITILKPDSLGIVDGKKIILEYLDKNEYGLAFEHLDYIITELGLQLTHDQKSSKTKIKTELNLGDDD